MRDLFHMASLDEARNNDGAGATFALHFPTASVMSEEAIEQAAQDIGG